MIKRILRKLDPDGRSVRRETGAAMSGRKVRYVTERRDGEDHVIGHEGTIGIKDKELIVLSSDKIVFRSPVDGVRMNDLLSGNGTMLTGYDATQSGELRTIIVHYTGI